MTRVMQQPPVRQGNPAQVSGSCLLEQRRYGPKVDVYSAGIIVWQMRTQLEPFSDVANSYELEVGIGDGSLRPPLEGFPPPLRLSLLAAVSAPTLRSYRTHLLKPGPFSLIHDFVSPAAMPTHLPCSTTEPSRISPMLPSSVLTLTHPMLLFPARQPPYCTMLGRRPNGQTFGPRGVPANHSDRFAGRIPHLRRRRGSSVTAIATPACAPSYRCCSRDQAVLPLRVAWRGRPRDSIQPEHRGNFPPACFLSTCVVVSARGEARRGGHTVWPALLGLPNAADHLPDTRTRRLGTCLAPWVHGVVPLAVRRNARRQPAEEKARTRRPGSHSLGDAETVHR